MALSTTAPRARTAGAGLAALLYALMFVAALAQTAIVPLLPGLVDHDGLSTTAAAALIAAPGAATFAVALPAGAVADRIGARRVTPGAGAPPPPGRRPPALPRAPGPL